MNILYDEAMPYAAQFFSSLGNARSFQAGYLHPDELKDADALLVRSTTQVDAKLLAVAPQLKFVATATAGFDHLDIDSLRQRNIATYIAAGCNATAVAEYVLSAILNLAEQDNFQVVHKSVAIVGVGKVGTALSKILQALKVKVLLCDPPLQALGDKRELLSFAEALNADIICLHTPLSKQGEHATQHMINAQQIAQLKPSQYLINACRGEVINNQALLSAFEAGQQLNVVLDVWEHEPTIERALIPFVRFASAHIAGHSIEGKARGTEMVYQALCAFMQAPAKLSLAQMLPHDSRVFEVHDALNEQAQLSAWVNQVYDIKNDDSVFRAYMAKSTSFVKLRKEYGPRREFSATTVALSQHNNKQWLSKLSALGFRVK